MSAFDQSGSPAGPRSGFISRFFDAEALRQSGSDWARILESRDCNSWKRVFVSPKSIPPARASCTQGEARQIRRAVIRHITQKSQYGCANAGMQCTVPRKDRAQGMYCFHKAAHRPSSIRLGTAFELHNERSLMPKAEFWCQHTCLP